MAARVRFGAAAHSPFAVEVRAAVDAYFRERGLSPKANGWMVVKSAILLAWAAASYVAILAPGVPWTVRWLACVSLGFACAGIGMSIGHDAVHGAYSRRRRLNRVLGLVMDVMGASSYMWRLTHNGAHHTYTNIDPVDTDLDYGSVLRMGPSAKPRFFHRWQSHYAFLVYALVVLYWICVRDIRYFVRRRVGPYRDLRHPRMAWTAFLAGRAIVVTYMIVVPLVVLSPSGWQFAIGFGTTAVVWGITMAIVFQLAHFVEGLPMLPLPADGLTVDDFFAHQLRSTADFATQNAALSWYVGGLNFQIEHHLFPKVCSVHYPALRPIVRELAARHGLPYYEFPTLRSALRSHVAYLERWGRPEAEGAERARPLAPASVSPSLPVYPGRMP